MAGRFNGAAVFQPRREFDLNNLPLPIIRLQWGRGLSTAESAVASGSQLRGNCQLQWGRGLSTAESVTAKLAAAPFASASMGPRSFNRGELTRPILNPECLAGLQWGRGLSTA